MRGTRVAKRALVQLSRVLGNASVLLRCHPGPLCHPSPKAGGILQPGDGCGAGSVLKAGCWCHPWDPHAVTAHSAPAGH